MQCGSCDGIFTEIGPDNTCPVCREPFKHKTVLLPKIPSIVDVADPGPSPVPQVPAPVADVEVKHQPFHYDVDPAVDHPHHYQGRGMESIDVIEAFDLDFCLGNTVKYVLRAGKKENEIQDLKKAIWYLSRRIEQLEKR